MEVECKRAGCTNSFASSVENQGRGFDKYCSFECRDEAMPSLEDLRHREEKRRWGGY
ncbi:hypothetical protein HUG10_21225 (plasmid) [Halorarum halophilum]|uniref:Uncharacterized protein n=1 Tax=Halorarum halophilum TaxID=2743090 RepID=A0A7D5GKV7_9EURY|nr:hypothetical protein [Halobaculum halophilum]QLG30111.1 hypothetical protein HUG10_21225 [Halobaculum halophilum]